MHPQRVMNQSSNYQQQNQQNLKNQQNFQQNQQNQQQQNSLRHTISNNLAPLQIGGSMVSGQQVLMRGSLPPNMTAQQFVVK